MSNVTIGNSIIRQIIIILTILRINFDFFNTPNIRELNLVELYYKSRHKYVCYNGKVIIN